MVVGPNRKKSRLYEPVRNQRWPGEYAEKAIGGLFGSPEIWFCCQEPVAMDGEPIEQRHLARRLGKRLGRVVQPHPVRGELGHPIRPEHLQLGEHRIVPDRHDVEREFIDALRIEGDLWQRLDRRQQRGRKDPPLRIVEQLEGAEKVGEQNGSVTAPHERHELPADPAPVRAIGHVELSESNDVPASDASTEPAEVLVALDEALRRLEHVDARQSKVVECRFFGGLTIEETATALGVSPRTVKRDWMMAQAWLHREMSTRGEG